MSRPLPPSPFFDPGNPDPRDRWIPRVSPVEGERLVVVMLADQVTKTLTHWIDGRTMPHFPDERVCQGCQMMQAPRWKGYIQAFQPKYGRLVVCEITPEATRTCPVLLQKNYRLRGHQLVLSRARGKKNNPVRAELIRGNMLDSLPEAFDIEHALLCIWGLRNWRTKYAGQPEDQATRARDLDQEQSGN